MISGVLYALLAGLMWGLIFVGPLIVPDYPALLQSMGRYLALGLIALPIAWLGRTRLRQLTRKDWSTALSLTLMGNVIYYACLASAIQRTGAPVSTMIIGTLPVVIPLFANVLYSQRDGRLSWRRLAPALALIGFGLLCVNIAELSQGLSDVSGWRYGSGIVLALISVACWAWYAQRPLAAGKSRQTSHDVGNGAGAGYAAGLVNRLCGGLSVAEYPESVVYPALWPASRAVYRSDDRHRSAVFLGGRAVLEYRQPKIANRYFRAADCF